MGWWDFSVCFNKRLVPIKTCPKEKRIGKKVGACLGEGRGPSAAVGRRVFTTRAQDDGIRVTDVSYLPLPHE